MNFKIKNIKFFLYFLLISLITFSSSLIIYERKDKIINKFNFRNNSSELSDSNNTSQIEKDWLTELRKGGYIVFLRHTERDKWKDVSAYDLLELKILNKENNFQNSAENEYFADSVCLNKRGKIQSKMIKEIFDYSGVKFNYVSSSPICRSKQTALLISNEIDDVNKKLVHSGAITSQTINEWRNNLKNYLLEVPIQENQNTLITAHGKMIVKEMFDNEIMSKEIGGPNFIIEEGGFFIISRKDNKLYMNKQYTKFYDFSKKVFK